MTTASTKTHHAQRTIYVLFLIMVIDWMGCGIITPVLQEVFYHTPMFDSIPPAWRTIALGFVFAIYGVIAFFSAPMMGRLSDKFGRKRMLMLTIAGTAISNVIAALSVITANYWLLVFARAFDGLTTGNSAIARAAVADSSMPEHKTKNFGFMGLAGSVGFVIGPLLGGLLSDSHLVSWFTTSTPFLFTAGIGIINLALIYILFHETLRVPDTENKTTPFSLRGFTKALKHPIIGLVFMLAFLESVGRGLFLQYFPYFLASIRAFTTQGVGIAFTTYALGLGFTQFTLLPRITKRLSPRHALLISIGISSIFMIGFTYALQEAWIYALMLGIGITYALAGPYIFTLLSNHTDKSKQGEIMGLFSSFDNIAGIIATVGGGILLGLRAEIPLLVGVALMIPCMWFILKLGNEKISHPTTSKV